MKKYSKPVRERTHEDWLWERVKERLWVAAIAGGIVIVGYGIDWLINFIKK